MKIENKMRRLSLEMQLQQLEKFNYLRMVFKSDRRNVEVNAVLREIYCSVATKREFSITAKLSVLKSVFVPILTLLKPMRYLESSWASCPRNLPRVTVGINE